MDPFLKILIAPNAFKGTLSARQAAAAIARGLRHALPNAQLLQCPIADGGDGFAEVLAHHFAASWVRHRVRNPLGKPISAAFALSRDGTTAIIEMARASGLSLLRRRDPMRASTFGTGQLIRAALDRGAKHLLIGIGGSASTDGGTGLARALGAQFLDAAGNPIPEGGAELRTLACIDLSAMDPRIRRVAIEVACDVDNPLYGQQGAACVFSPQKGATPSQAKLLDAGLRRLARIMHRDLSVDVQNLPGAGAAGGAGAGLVACCGARLVSGFDLVARVLRLQRVVRTSDLVITGEGRLDATTRHNKAPAAIRRLAQAAARPVVAICGTAAAGASAIGFDAVFACGPHGIQRPREAVTRAAWEAGNWIARSGRANCLIK